MMSAMKVAAVQSDWVGKVIDGRFLLRQWLGGSGGGGVFLTELPGTQEKAAIKLMQADAGVDARIAFAANASRTQPHLVRVFENGSVEIDDAAFVYVVTEYADEVLSSILPLRPLAPEEVKEMLLPVLDELSELHTHGLVHGRLKPSNILGVNDELKLSADSIQPAGTTADQFAPVSVFDSPERTNGTLSPASDIWSFGVTIVEALTQRTPDWNRTANRDPQLPEGMPEPFATLAASCLRVDPARRATLHEIRRQMGLPAQSTSATTGETNLSPDNETGRSRRPRPSVLAAVVVVLIAVVALIWWRSHGTTRTMESSVAPAAEAPAQAAPATAVSESQPQAVQQEQPTPQQAAPEPVQQPTVSQPAPIPAQPRPASGSAAAKGAVADRVMPNILPEANRSIQGKVNVAIRLNVNANGEVSDASFESAGPSRYFSRVAMEAARQWKFTPPHADGQPVASSWLLRFQFTRGNVDITPTETAP
jgi:TonB family C-terminal domain